MSDPYLAKIKNRKELWKEIRRNRRRESRINRRGSRFLVRDSARYYRKAYAFLSEQHNALFGLFMEELERQAAWREQQLSYYYGDLTEEQNETTTNAPTATEPATRKATDNTSTESN